MLHKLCYVINNNHNKNKNTFSPILLPDSNHLNKELINIYIYLLQKLGQIQIILFKNNNNKYTFSPILSSQITRLIK